MAFSNEFLEEIKKALLEEKSKIETKISEISDADEDIVTSEASEDQAQSLADMGNKVALINTLNKNLEDIESALERISKKTYGICKYCNNPIEEKRLIARPTSSSCLACKQGFTGK